MEFSYLHFIQRRYMLKNSLLISLFKSNSIKILFVIMLLILTALGNTYLSVYSHSNSDAEASALLPQASMTSTPECCETELHTLVGSYYSIENNTDAKLLLNNKGDEELEVKPTLYNFQGQELQLPPVTVDPQSFRFINLEEWAVIGGESFKTGNIKLIHGGKDLVLGAQIYLTDEEHSLSFEEKLAEIGTFNSQRQEAVWWMPSEQTQVQIVLTNTTDNPLTLTAQLTKKPHHTGNAQLFELNAHETKVLDLRQDFIEGNQFSKSDLLGLSLTHAASDKDALLARVLVKGENQGYSNTVQFSNPNGGKSSEYQGAGFQIEDINNGHLTPVIVARNVGEQDSTVKIRIPYTRVDGSEGKITLPQEIVKPGWLSRINTQKIIQRVRQEQITVASLEIEYDTAPGTIIVAAHSVSDDHNLVFRVPLWDPFAQRSSTGGYPWRIEGTSKTDVFIKNITDEEEDYVAYLVWENGGTYMIGLNPVAAHQTVKIDIKKLRDEQIPDESGRTIPVNLSSGQIQWTLRRKDNLPGDDARASLALIGRSEQIDLIKGVISNYSCINCCPGSYQAALIEPSSAPIPLPSEDTIKVGSTKTYVAKEKKTTCYGSGSDFFLVPATWSSSDTSIATVDITTGVVSGAAAGSVTIQATWQVRSYTVINHACVQVAQYYVTAARNIKIVEVTNVTTNTPDVKKVPPTSSGDANIIHFVTPKGNANDLVTLTATITPNVSSSIDWEGATEDPSNPLQATVSKSTPIKHTIKIKSNGTVIKELRVWVVWANLSASSLVGPRTVYSTNPPANITTGVSAEITWTASIDPSDIINDSDRPDLSGTNISNPPGSGTFTLGGDDLVGGVNAKWDITRRIRQKYFINGVEQMTSGIRAKADYPSNDRIGNDDGGVYLEDNDPYNNPAKGNLTAVDTPDDIFLPFDLNVGDIIELKIQFGEFARLELDGTWYRISDFGNWRFHINVVKVKDDQLVAVGTTVSPYTNIIGPGSDGVLQADLLQSVTSLSSNVILGDDTIGVTGGVKYVTAGPNGLAESYALNNLWVPKNPPGHLFDLTNNDW